MAYRNRSTKQGRDLWNNITSSRIPNPVVLSPSQINRMVYNTSWIPVWGDILRWRDNVNWMNEYMAQNHVSWADVKYPTKVPGSGSSGAVYFSVSRNLSRLYRQ